jgi:hypothetical protein
MTLIGWLLAALLAAGFWAWAGVAAVWGLVWKGRRRG